MDIQDYPNYLIYPDGTIFSKKRNIFLKLRINNKGYICVRLYNKEGWKELKVHRLVAIHYIPNPNNLPTVDHINRIKHDNRVENLRWADDILQCSNKSIQKDNKSGYTNIHYCKKHNCWKYKKFTPYIKRQKYFKNKIDAICYKYIMELRIKSYWNTCRITDQ